VQAVTTIFDADWDRTQASFDDDKLVVSPVNARCAFDTLIAKAQKTLLIEAELMNDRKIEQALVNAVKRGVQVQDILPQHDSSSDPSEDTSKGVGFIKQGGVQVREDTILYMHAKLFIVDRQTAFV